MGSVIELQPLTRVEGHGRITISLAGTTVERVEVRLFESPRLFEALLRGKRVQEVPEIICRICSLCSTVHRVVALQAVEAALGLSISPQARLYRELIVNGGHIQSHALHLFCLVLPDHFEADGFADLARTAPELLAQGLRIKGVGNMIQELVGGRLIHPVTLLPGGMGKPVGREGLLRIRAALEEIVDDTVDTVKFFSSPSPEAPPLPAAGYLAVDADGAPPLFGTGLRLSGEEPIGAERYRDLLVERPRRGTNAKWSHINDRRTITGAVARLNLGIPLSQTAARLREEHAEDLIGRDIRANNLAQAIELVHAVEHSRSLVDLLLHADFPREPLPEATLAQGSGTSVIEAPRGVLIHHYAFDEAGSCIDADIITPTAINQKTMEDDLFVLARACEGADERELKRALEIHVRAYDPCISCAVHVVRV